MHFTNSCTFEKCDFHLKLQLSGEHNQIITTEAAEQKTYEAENIMLSAIEP